MKILYTTTYFPNTDGTSLVIQNISQNLKDFGHQSIIIASDLKTNLKLKSSKDYLIIKIPFHAYNFIYKTILKGKEFKFLKKLKDFINILEKRIISAIQKYAKNRSLDILWGLFYDPFGWKLLLKLITLKTKDIDLFFTTPTGRSCITATLIAAKIKKKPVVVAPAYHSDVRVYNYYNKQWAEILKKFNLVFPYTIAELKYLNKIGVPRNILEVMGLGIPFKEINQSDSGEWRKRLNIPENSFVNLYLTTGIADKNKGIDAVIKAAKKLDSFFFVFVGRGIEQWKTLSKKYDLKTNKNIRYIEFVSQEEKHQLYNTVDLIVKPSISDSFGFVYFEGMSAGKPIITSNIKPMMEVADNVGLTVPFDDPNELIEAIKKLKRDKDLYKRFSNNAIIKAKNRSWGKKSIIIERILKKTIENFKENY